MTDMLTTLKSDYITIESLLNDYNMLLSLESNLEENPTKEQLQFISKINNEVCERNNISTKEYDSCEFVSMESLDYNSRVIVNIAKEDLKSIIATLFEKIKIFIEKAYQNLKLFIVKLGTTYPLAERNNMMLIEKINVLKAKKAFVINHREQLKWVVNKAPILFLINKDIHGLEAFLSTSNHLDIVNGFFKELSMLQQALLVSPEINLTGFIDNSNKAIDNILKTKTYKSVYDSLPSSLPDLSSVKSKFNIYRADGNKCKYRLYEEGAYENGIKTIKFSNKVASIPVHMEDRMVIPKLFSPDEVVRILRKNLTYIASIRQLGNSIDDVIKKCNELFKTVTNKVNPNMKSGSYKTLLNIYMKMNNFIVNTLSVECLLSNYTTSQNIYYTFNKYIEIGFNLSRTISNEAQLPNLPEGVVNGDNPEFVRALNLNEGGPGDNIHVNIKNQYEYNRAFKCGEETFNLNNIQAILNCVLESSFIQDMKVDNGARYLNLFNDDEVRGYVNISTGMNRLKLDIQHMINNSIVETNPYIIEENKPTEFTKEMVLEYLGLTDIDKCNMKLYKYLLDQIDILIISLNSIISKIKETANIKINTVVSS